MLRNLTAAAICGLMIGGAASAATVAAGPGGLNDGWATAITYDDAAARGTSNDRANPLNALGATDGKFFEIGRLSSIDLTFGSLFAGTAAVVEVTFGNRAGFVEFAEIFVGRDGVFTKVADISNAMQTTVVSLGTGTFDTLRIVDATPGSGTGGFDIDSVRVSPVPVPAAGFLLLGGLAGLVALRRRSA